MDSELYFGRDGKPISRAEAYALMEDIEKRRVAETHLDDEVWVSTVHLVHNHNFGEGPPIIFETMVFGGDFDGWQDRYRTESEARAGHKQTVAALREGREPPTTWIVAT